MVQMPGFDKPTPAREVVARLQHVEAEGERHDGSPVIVRVRHHDPRYPGAVFYRRPPVADDTALSREADRIAAKCSKPPMSDMGGELFGFAAEVSRAQHPGRQG